MPVAIVVILAYLATVAAVGSMWATLGWIAGVWLASILFGRGPRRGEV